MVIARNTTKDEASKGGISRCDTLPVPAQLPLWPDDLRGLPLAAIRSALFAPVQRGARSAMERTAIAVVGDWKIIYTGLQLDQGDFDVWMQVLHWSRQAPLGQPLQFKTRDMLKAIRRSPGKSGRDWLLRALSRLSANEIDITKGGVSYAGSLIQEQGRDNVAGMHYVILNPRLGVLYGDGWAALRFDQRHALGQNQLAKWLHLFVLNQRQPLTFGIERFAALANTGYTRERDFCRRIDEAVEVIQAQGVPLVVLWDRRRHNITLTRANWQSEAKPTATGA